MAAICSDHTPVGADDKLLPFGEAKPGATGLEVLLPLTLKWAETAKVAPSGRGAHHLRAGRRCSVWIAAIWRSERRPMSAFSTRRRRGN